VVIYPGRTIKVGEQDATIVKALKRQLNEALGIEADPALRLDPDSPSFGPAMKRMVMLFQARHVDSTGRPLKQDGEIGSVTWATLFGGSSVPSGTRPIPPILATALRIAAEQEARQVREVPRNSNKGPEVSAYLKRAGCPPGNAWCCAFTYWCLDEAAKELGRRNPMVKTAGCLDHWQRAAAAGAKRIATARAIENPALVQPGMIFVMDHGRGLGHTGFVEKVSGGFLTTIEGNTDASRSREGGGVYRLTRKIGEINKGFLDYSAL
jgi:hypothetical protein